ncbi:hypothetical protein BHM03_00056749 [Ensete ventricosum]|nr:hypothetical protein BHM03_00056749 [Ensete ventricosum]
MAAVVRATVTREEAAMGGNDDWRQVAAGKEGMTESKGHRGCSGSGSKEVAAGKKGEEERWQRRRCAAAASRPAGSDCQRGESRGGRVLRLKVAVVEEERKAAATREIYRRDRESRWEHIGRSPKEDRMTYRKNTGGYRIGGMSGGCTAVAQVFGRLMAADSLSLGTDD